MLSNTSQMTIFFLSGRQCIGAHALCHLCVQHSPTAVALLTSFLPSHASPTAPSWTHWVQDLGNHTAALVWVVSQKDWRNQQWLVVGFSQCTNTAFEQSMQFSRLPVLPGSAEAQVIWGGKVKHRLIAAYFVGNISAKKYHIPFSVSKL